ncbi:MAG TPA: DMT family transporter [Terriglobales bacterium]|nr:DMT family transporter [Terriglobales bacterium]
MTARKYLVLLAVAIFASCGDVFLARGMRDFGAVSSANWRSLFTALLNPWIIGGIVLLILFFSSYLTALSWADLTYVTPATALSYVIMAALGKMFLHESVTPSHWLGIALITVGVGVVASGPSRTSGGHPARHGHRPPREFDLRRGSRSES